MDNIFLRNRRLQESLKEPDFREISHVEQIIAIAEYIRGRNFIDLRNGDSKLCKKINGEIVDWINTHTTSKAQLWVCSPYPNLRNKEFIMEHIVGVVKSEEEAFVFDGTAGQTTVGTSSILVKRVSESNSEEENLKAVFGGQGWKLYSQSAV